MKWFYNLGIGKKLILGFIIVSTITGIVGYMGIINMSKINDMADKLYINELNGISYLKEANINLLYSARAENNAMLAMAAEDRNRYLNNIKKYDKTFLDYFNKAKPLIHSEKGKELVAKLMKAWEEYVTIENQIINTIKIENLNDKKESVRLAQGIGREKMNVIDELLTELTKIKEENGKEYSEETTKIYESSRLFMIVLVLSGIIVGILIGIFISRIIRKPIQMSLDFAQKLAEGDFRERIDLDQNDEIGTLAVALNKAADDLEKLISEIMVATQNLSQAVEQIASGNQNLSQRTSEQASSLEEIASTIEEATAAINQNTDNSSQANKMANTSSQMAVEGGKLVGDAVASINEINQSSKKIAEIISVINEISFQTNLLALNAAVEAARAGEQGRGFAVVAGEVRNLAQRSGGAAKEIGTLINDSVDKIEKGTEMANKSGEALNEIIESVKNVGNIISEIAASSNEQKQGISQINTAITEMDSMTQQNASLVEETASASEEMANQAQELLGMMKRFKINESLQENTYSKKHKELHLKAAEVKIKDAKKGIKKSASDVKNDIKTESSNDIKEKLSSEGFEEF